MRDGSSTSTRRRPTCSFGTGREINMVGPAGHIAFRVDDIEELKRRLDAAGIPYSDYGQWAIKNWHQVFVHDPMGNVLEFHQIVDCRASSGRSRRAARR